MTSGDVEVAVIGGGAAGIGAARRLSDAGVKALILEARDRLGGRAWTIEAGGFPVDLGCGWLHSAKRNPWTAIAKAQGRTIDRTPPPWARATSQPGLTATEADAMRAALWALHERADALPESEPDRSLADLLEPGGRWNALIDAISGYYSGAELARVSARDLGRYADDGVNWRVAEGYGAAIAAHGAGLDVAFDSAVTRIDHGGRRIRVETRRGIVEADAAIVTLPSAVIAADEALFAPTLPDKTRAAAGLPLGRDDKLFLSLADAEAFEPETRAFGDPRRVDTASYQFRPFGRPMIECYFGGALAADLEKGGAAAFFAFARNELIGLYGGDFARRIAPLALHGWSGDPFARGAYSYALPGRADDRAALAAPLDGRLFFAGEACSREDFSTAHGAYLTGLAAAEQAIGALKR
ncbi:MAG: NAD(P)/FAD-dependent oxidoreductase [Roseiarcus sp.]|jgi:monoamine oxidase